MLSCTSDNEVSVSEALLSQLSAIVMMRAPVPPLAYQVMLFVVAQSSSQGSGCLLLPVYTRVMAS